MKIKSTNAWNRRDFRFTGECESCNHIEENISGYDDANFYNNVVPNMKCSKCKESTISLGIDTTSTTPKYSPNIVI